MDRRAWEGSRGQWSKRDRPLSPSPDNFTQTFRVAVAAPVTRLSHLRGFLPTWLPSHSPRWQSRITITSAFQSGEGKVARERFALPIKGPTWKLLRCFTHMLLARTVLWPYLPTRESGKYSL